FASDIPIVGGMFVKDADPLLVEELRKQNLLYRHTLETHSYPHCWRCSSPLIYMARDSWYIRTTAIRDVMRDNNRQVAPHPDGGGPPPGGGSGRVRRVARAQRRLGDLARARVRHAAAVLGVWSGCRARRSAGQLCRPRRAGGAAAGSVRSAQAAHRQVDVP